MKTQLLSFMQKRISDGLTFRASETRPAAVVEPRSLPVRNNLFRYLAGFMLVGAAVLIWPVGAGATASDIDENGNTTPLERPDLSDCAECPEPPDDDIPTIVPALPEVTAEAAIVVDRDSGEVLGAKNPDLRWAPASTTKIMTGLLAAEAIAAGTVSLSDTVIIQSDVNDEGGGAAGLAPGDEISLRDLLYMMLLASKNDAASAVGTYVGSQPWGDPSWMGRAQFVQWMNERAAELGLSNTSYIDISGRDPEDLYDTGNFPVQVVCHGNDFDNPPCAHYSTARDLAALARVALNDPLFAAIVKTTSWRTTTWRSSTGAVRDTTFVTSNQLLPTRQQAYEGAYGVKTGTSDMARENLVSAARTLPQFPPVVYRNVVAVVLGSDNETTTTADRFTDSRILLDFGLHRGP